MKLSDPDDRPEVIARDRKMRGPKSSDLQVGTPEEPETSRASAIASRAVAPAIFVGIVIAGIVRRHNRDQ